MTGSFDPADIAAQARDHGEDPTTTVIGQLVGYASVCWEDIAAAGVFQSEQAAAAVEATLTWLRDSRRLAITNGDHRPVSGNGSAFRQVGWIGHKDGTVYAIDDEAGVRTEPGGFSPLWIEVGE